MRLQLTVAVLLFSTIFSFAQRDLYNNTQKLKLARISKEISSQFSTNYQKAVSVAQQKGWKIEGNLGNGKTFLLSGIDETGQPLYIATESNANAAATTRTNQLYAGGSLGLSLSGSSDAVKNRFGIWDGGAVLATHQEFGTRITQQDNVTGSDLHATHVAGTMVAAGVSPQARGMSFGANLRAWNFSNDVSEMTAAASNLAISNHSYGFQAGWVFNGTTSRWAWYGNLNVSQTEDYKFGFYDSNAQAWDKIAVAAPTYLIVKSAGNNRDETGPSAGTFYFLGTSTRDSSNIARSRNDSYDCLSTTSTAKNILTVGAIAGTGGVPPVQASDSRISSFSSWGPTDDGRIKPDLVAVGVNLFSTSNTSTTGYSVLSGTSMSAPQTSGSLLLLQEAYANLNAGQLMKSSTLKGLALHTADDAGNAGPDYVYGWGVLNTEKATKVILNTDKSHSLTERNLANGSTFTQKITASGKGALAATICWTDPEATVFSVSPDNLNNRTPKLVNDLDIRITDEINNYLPFILNPDKPAEVATRGDNIRDNIEQILIPDAVPGRTYTLTVKHKGTLNNTSQDYALIISGIGGKDYCSSTPTTVQDNIESVKVAGLSTGLKISSGQQVALDVVLKGTNPKTTNVYIDWNLDGVFDEATEKVATSEALIGTTFSTTFKAPSGLLAGNGTLMRVVSAENTTSTNLKNCGAYDKGITKDYAIQFVRPEVDLSVSDLISPDVATFCSSSVGSVTVSLKNIGNTLQRNIPVTVRVLDKTNVVATLRGTYTGQLAPFVEDKLVLDGTFNAVAGITYTFEVTINLANDQDFSNNVKTFTRQVTTTSTPISAVVATCEGATNLNVKTNETSAVLWYDAPTGGNLLFTGNTGSFAKPANLTKLYAGVNDFSGSVGIKQKSDLGGGTYFANFGPEPIIVTQTPLVIESARVYVGTSGTITFSISRVSDLTPISSVTFKVNATRTMENQTVNANNQLVDDPTDQGIVLPLNLAIPVAGTYKLTQECTNGASIYRSNLNAGTTTGGQEIKGHPFTIPNVISITGALFSGNIIKTGYYYTYDMKIKSLGCPSARVEVPIMTQSSPKVSISPADKVSICQDLTKDLTATLGNNLSYQWLRNGVVISGATNAVYRASLAGSYTVTATENGLCSTTSSPVVANIFIPITPKITFNGNVLSIPTGTNPTWFVGGVIIPNANQNTVSPTRSGIYTVKSTDENGCESLSDNFSLTITAIEEEVVSETTAKIFPNPASDRIRVEYRSPNPTKLVQAEIINMFGMVITSKDLVKTNGIYTADIDVSKQNQGKFFVRIVTDDIVRVIPLVIARD